MFAERVIVNTGLASLTNLKGTITDDLSWLAQAGFPKKEISFPIFACLINTNTINTAAARKLESDFIANGLMKARKRSRQDLEKEN